MEFVGIPTKMAMDFLLFVKYTLTLDFRWFKDDDLFKNSG